jgi:hypothetical protein
LLVQTIEDYWNTGKRLDAAKGNKTKYGDIVKETGVFGLPMCSQPCLLTSILFPLDPFHLFYENCMPHFWDTWVTFSEPSEIVHMSQDIASTLGAEAEKAIATLPPSLSGGIQDPSQKCHSQHKIYEWMALLHWYLVPIAWELGFNQDVVESFALFSNVVEYAMTRVT